MPDLLTTLNLNNDNESPFLADCLLISSATFLNHRYLGVFFFCLCYVVFLVLWHPDLGDLLDRIITGDAGQGEGWTKEVWGQGPEL